MSTVVPQPRSPHVKKWTKEEYLDLVERGAFRNQRVYLFRGDIIEMAPQGHPHEFAIMKLTRYLTATFPEPHEVRIQLSLITPGQSVPEPDAVVCTEEQAARRPHPNLAELVVEVSYSSLADDRALAQEYAAARIPEYWVIDVDHRKIEVFRQPLADSSALLGFRYQTVQVLGVGDEIAPLALPTAAVPVSMFFP